MQKSPLLLGLCVRKTRAGESQDYRDFLLYAKTQKPAISNSSGLKRVFEKLRFRDGLVWIVGLIVET